jgi:hypothetical protein
VSDKLGEITILSLDEGSYRFLSDIASISCKQVEGVEGHYSDCSNKEPIELKQKEQGFDETAEIVFDRIKTATPGAVDWSFGNLFKNKKNQIIFTIIMIVVAITVVMAIIIFLYCYCNRTKAAVIAAPVLPN